jgi:hypothetical protein
MIGQVAIRAAVAILCGTLLAITAAQADVTVESRFSVEGNGIMSAGNMSGTSKTTISGDRSRVDSDMQLNSRFMRVLAHGAMGPTAQIVRLDQGKVQQLDVKKKQYTEQTFEEMRAQMQKVTNQSVANGTNGKATPSVVDESKCEWLEPKATVKRTGQKANIAGFDAEEVQITASQPCKDKTTGAICEVALGLDEWLAPQFTSGEEAQVFGHAYAQRMGLDLRAANQDAAASAQAMFSRYKGIWTQIAGKMKEMKGYPVRSGFTLAVGGEQCQDAQTAQHSSSDGADAAATSPSGLASQLTGKLAGAFFHKKASETSDQASAPPIPAGTVPLVTITSELVSMSTAAVSPDSFEVPPGFKKIANKADQ